MVRSQAANANYDTSKSDSLTLREGEWLESDTEAILKLWKDSYYAYYKDEFGDYDIMNYVKLVTPKLKHLVMYKENLIVADAGVRTDNQLAPQISLRSIKSEFLIYVLNSKTLSSSERKFFHCEAAVFLDKFPHPMIVGLLLSNDKARNAYRKLGFKDYYCTLHYRG